MKAPQPPDWPRRARQEAPPVFRPQPTPKCLQRKVAVTQARPMPIPHAALAHKQRGANSDRGVKLKPFPAAGAQLNSLSPPVRLPRNSTVQRFSSRVIQAVKFYPNLHPGAVEPVEPSNIFRLDSFADQYRLHKVHSHGVNVPNQQYNFVRTSEGEMLLHSRYRHPSIAEGKQVLYAGEIFFNNGKLQWWSNGSGHYQPFVEDAQQASLPMDHFFSYQQIIKGEHTRKKG